MNLDTSFHDKVSPTEPQRDPFETLVAPAVCRGRPWGAAGVLAECIRAIDVGLSDVDVMDRDYRYSDNPKKRVEFLDVSHGRHLDGFLPSEAAKIVTTLKLVPAQSVAAELRAQGYRSGMPNKQNEDFYFHTFWRDKKLAEHVPGTFDRNCFAARIKSSDPFDEKEKLMLIVLPVVEGDYHNHLSYADRAHGALFRLLERHGVPIHWNSIGMTHHQKGDVLLDASVGYVLPKTSHHPRVSEIRTLLSGIPGMERVSPRTFKMSVGDLPDFKESAEYPGSITIHLRNSSDRVRVQARETAAAEYVSNKLKEFGSESGAYVRSERGPYGPNYLTIAYGYYCIEDDDKKICEALAKTPGVRKGQFSDYLIFPAEITELGKYGDKPIKLRLCECYDSGW